MTARPAAEERGPALGSTRIVDTLGWAVGVAWTTSPPLVVGVVALSLVRSTVAPGLALSGRGLINAAVAESQQGQAQFGPLVPWLLAALSAPIPSRG